MRADDHTRLEDMLASAQEILAFASGREPGDMADDRMRLLAILRLLEVVGEAANSVSDEFRTEHPDIPWGRMIATRNRLIHGYRDVDVEIVEAIVEENVPALVQALENILH